jgi:cellulose biosynthesis protein BcsQ
VFEAADVLLVPIIPATLSSRTFDQLERLLDGGPRMFAFFSMVDARKRLHREVMERLRLERATVLPAAIPSCAEIERMGVERDAVISFAPGGRAAIAYEALWADVRSRLAEG